jgi:hypothetical protein
MAVIFVIADRGLPERAKKILIAINQDKNLLATFFGLQLAHV